MITLKIALTGGITCGKSSVLQIIKQHSIDTLSLDTLARAVVAPNTSGLNALVAQFGTEILHNNQSLNRAVLRQKLFESVQNQQAIEAILHPRILEKMHADIKQLNTALVVVEVPLLIENNLTSLFDRAIVVDCSAENQLKRLLQRKNMNQALAQNILSAQASRAQRLALNKQLPTDVLENNADILQIQQKAHDLAKKLLNL